MFLKGKKKKKGLRLFSLKDFIFSRISGISGISEGRVKKKKKKIVETRCKPWKCLPLRRMS